MSVKEITPATNIFWEFIPPELHKNLIGVVVLGFIVYFFQKFYDTKHERFLKAKALSEDELDLLENLDRVPEFNEKTTDEQFELRQAYTLHQELETIKNEKWSGFYRSALNKLNGFIARVLGEKIALSKAEVKDIPLFNKRFFTVKSYEFCLLLALVYPLMLSLVSWLIAGSLIIGGVEFEPVLIFFLLL
ncbi:MAG: hypothetical protein MJK04_06795, partial [Psychrosphaera sp.]|nr:hypothetical protein [Psychrosphaera sp.]